MTLIALLCKCEVMMNGCEKCNLSCILLHELSNFAEKPKKSALYDNEPMFRFCRNNGFNHAAGAMGANVCLLRRAIYLLR